MEQVLIERLIDNPDCVNINKGFNDYTETLWDKNHPEYKKQLELAKLRFSKRAYTKNSHVPIMIEGKFFNSFLAASAETKLSINTIARRVRGITKGYPNWRLASNDEILENLLKDK